MVHDIRTNILRIGQSLEEVERFLGRPDNIRETVHEYLLGMCSGFHMDFDTLDIHFNAEGKVTGVYVTQH